jgi:hypothetical protein
MAADLHTRVITPSYTLITGYKHKFVAVWFLYFLCIAILDFLSWCRE